MSGGHFDYQDNRIDDMMDIIKHDIKYNDVEWHYDPETDQSTEDYGYQHSKETLDILKKLLKDMKKVMDVLHYYDWYVSGDTCEETFLEKASKYYRCRKIKKNG